MTNFHLPTQADMGIQEVKRESDQQQWEKVRINISNALSLAPKSYWPGSPISMPHPRPLLPHSPKQKYKIIFKVDGLLFVADLLSSNWPFPKTCPRSFLKTVFEIFVLYDRSRRIIRMFKHHLKLPPKYPGKVFEGRGKSPNPLKIDFRVKFHPG